MLPFVGMCKCDICCNYAWHGEIHKPVIAFMGVHHPNCPIVNPNRNVVGADLGPTVETKSDWIKWGLAFMAVIGAVLIGRLR